VSIENLDSALHRIVERAANAVRAPAYVLAVRTAPGAEPQVYSHGIDGQGARALAHAALEGSTLGVGSTLVADVTSSRRPYGHLIAHNPGASAFFPQEQEMLNLYAKHAAAVLDITTALSESAERHNQVSSLLSLAHAVAQAGTSREVGQRLAAAMPQVVDCDRVSVWQWDDKRQCIAFLANWAHSPEHEAILRRLTVSPADTPYMRSMVAKPQPQFFDRETDDPFMSQMMLTFDNAAIVAVPIIAHDAFLGLLIVSVGDGPERLRANSDLTGRLTGVAALAAPALQNGVLVDQLHHKASHDGLTGLLNRIGFRQRIDSALASTPPAQVGLLFVDLNDFKLINDAYGHETGDELLCQVAARLAAIGRGNDEIARLGGDEFAIILADVRRDDQVRAAERRVRGAFEAPFDLGEVSVSISASVGGGVWPEDGDTVRELIRHADAAMYRDKASGRRSSPTGARTADNASVSVRPERSVAQTSLRLRAGAKGLHRGR
jgi:diguanylate cyclase (GGDEF)-like protein